MSENITRPIIGIQNRTAQEVFDIMVARIGSTPPPQALVVGDALDHEVDTVDGLRAEIARLESLHRSEIADMAERFRSVNVEKAMQQLGKSLPGDEEEISRLKQRIADLTTERDNLATIVASGIDEVAGAALDDAEETIQQLAIRGKIVTDEMIETGARAVASRWGRAAVWEEDEAVARSVLTAALSAVEGSEG